MKPARRSKLLKFALLIFVLGLAFMIAGYFLADFAEKKVSEKLNALGIKSRAVKLNLFRRSLTIIELSYDPPADSVGQRPHHMTVAQLTISGISIIRLFRQKELHVSHLRIEGADFFINKNLHLMKKDSAGGIGDSSALKSIHIGTVEIRNAIGHIANDSTVEYAAQADITLYHLHWRDSSNYGIEAAEVLLQNVFLQKKGSLYKMTIQKAAFDSEKKLVEIDSVELKPLLGKFEFARKVGKQVTRTEIVLPKIILSGFDYPALKDSLLHVGKMEVQQARVWAFRDKRLRFDNPYIPLPMQMLQKLKFGILIDSILIHDSNVVSEEMSVEGVQTGRVDIGNLEASVANFTNRIKKEGPGFATIQASGTLMKSGEIKATFQLPLEQGKNYTSQGIVKIPDLRELNSATEALAYVRIESGKLNKLKFDFAYNENRATGKLEMNYENLQFSGLKKGDRARTVNLFKTVLINTIVKNGKGRKTPMEERVGAINYERDKRRFVFNYWIKSLLSGIQTVVSPSVQPKPKKEEKKS